MVKLRKAVKTELLTFEVVPMGKGGGAAAIVPGCVLVDEGIILRESLHAVTPKAASSFTEHHEVSTKH
jgi:hypothetical protein